MSCTYLMRHWRRLMATFLPDRAVAGVGVEPPRGAWAECKRYISTRRSRPPTETHAGSNSHTERTTAHTRLHTREQRHVAGVCAPPTAKRRLAQEAGDPHGVSGETGVRDVDSALVIARGPFWGARCVILRCENVRRV
eukprot:281228-Prymnesium_polylepis.1